MGEAEAPQGNICSVADSTRQTNKQFECPVSIPFHARRPEWFRRSSSFGSQSAQLEDAMREADTRGASRLWHYSS